ncbi:MAG: butyrate kinase [Bacteroidales bacterium]|nr:butyrate kinase [Bacteroidales bacterium]MDD6731937.1 butyrate kinase [Bacteroidales bacterium]
MKCTEDQVRTVETPGFRILVINPGSTSTKVAVYIGDSPLQVSTIRHKPEELKLFEQVVDQKDFRRQIILDWLKENNIPFCFDAIIGRGGLAKPVPGGVYRVNRKMCYDTYSAMRKHACNLGCIIAAELAAKLGSGCKAYIADPGVVDELVPEARISGSPLMPRICIWHALNQRAIARRHAKSIGKRYEDLNLIICHLGGGISVAAHEHGRAIDANNALDGEGPFSPERAGTLPAADLIHLCFSGRYTEDQLKKRVAGQAGLMAHLGTTDIPEIMRMIENGDQHAKLLIDAMIYHTARSIAAEGAVLKGKVDAILLTGGIAYSEYITQGLRERVEFIAPVHIYPGEDEMKALALNALAVLRGEREAKEYE